MSVPHTNRKSPRARRRAGVRNLARRVDGRSYAPACVSPRRKCNESRPQTQAVVTNLARRFHRNQQYSIVALTDGGGNITERYAYDAYGKPKFMDASGTEISGSADGNRILYTGREYEESIGLYYYRARWYSPELGRFLSRDPTGYLDGDSLYQNYFRLEGTDPTGETAVSVSQSVTGTAGCGSVSASNKIRISVDEAGEGRFGPAFVVQELTYSAVWNDCTRTDSCCESAPHQTYYCKVYEVLGRLSISRKGKPVISPGPNRRYREVGVISDNWRFPNLTSGTCGSTGTANVSSSVTVMHGDLDKYWERGNRPVHKCREAGVKLMPGPSESPSGTVLGSSSGSASVTWDCCDGASSVILRIQSSDGGISYNNDPPFYL